MIGGCASDRTNELTANPTRGTATRPLVHHERVEGCGVIVQSFFWIEVDGLSTS